MIRNPVIRGFNPDPSFLRVEDDYYLATSTFEWLPGVQIHHSRDLVNWRLLDHGLKQQTLPDLRGIPDSGGIWAPSLSYDEGTFYLIYTIVRTCGMGRPFKDHHNYVITAESIHGPWSEPVYLNSSGFDASLFHEDDGSKWIVNIQWDFRKDRPRFDGIVLQQYDPAQRKLVGPITNILRHHELIEGPNLYKVNGTYYLMLAEGGTGWNHGISMARASKITGPYELDPKPVLTSRDDPALDLQKAGHGELIQTPGGEWYLAHLCSRPVGHERRCMLGRETAIQKVRWTEDGWLRLDRGDSSPQVNVVPPHGLSPLLWPSDSATDHFDGSSLSLHWAAPRVTIDESWVTVKARPGWLRLRGRESQQSLFEQSLVARRLQAFRCTVETCLDFKPTHFTQMAGLICYYDTRTHYYLRVGHHEKYGKVLGISLTDDGKYDELIEHDVRIADWPLCWLRAVIDFEKLQFFASPDGEKWQQIGPMLDASKLSDDYGQGLHFTGAFVGLCAQDLSSALVHADFDYFKMENHT